MAGAVYVLDPVRVVGLVGDTVVTRVAERAEAAMVVAMEAGTDLLASVDLLFVISRQHPTKQVQEMARALLLAAVIVPSSFWYR